MTMYFGHRAPEVEMRAVLAWQRIMDNPTSITVLRGSTTLAAQTVRIEHKVMMPQEVTGGAGTASTRRAIVFGIVDHPTEADTDLQKGDRFVFGGAEYRVIDVVLYPGELQATVERGL